MKKFIFSLIICVFSILIFIYWAGHNYLQQNSNNTVFELENRKSFNLDNSAKDIIKVMSWNVSYFYGLGSDGSAYQKKDLNYYENKIISAARLIREENVDIVAFQEIDFKSSRTGFMDQLKEIAELTDLNYIAYAPSWQANYVPYPYFSDHFGKIYSGGGVISRYPIITNRVFLLPKPDTNPWWYNHLYLNRYIQMVNIKVGDTTLGLFNIHLEAFDIENRQQQAYAVKQFAQERKTDLIVGDFNTIPDQALKRSNFAGFPEDNYQSDQTYNILLSMGYSQSLANDMTFPAHRPDRKLDYILYKKDIFTLIDAKVINTQQSDHRPILSTLKSNN